MPLNIANTSLSAATTGTGPTISTRGFVHATLYAIWSSGVTAGVVAFEASGDGTNFASIGTTSFVANSTTMVTMSGQAHQYLRGRISTTVVGGTVTVIVVLSGPLPNDAGFQTGA